MSEDQFQRQVDFIVAQQAKFSEDIARLEQQTRENREDLARLVVVTMRLANHVEQHDRQIAALIDAGIETDKRFKETDERMNALITMAERFFNRNGN